MVGKIIGSKYYLDGREVSKGEFDREIPDKSLSDGDFGAATGRSTQSKLSDALAVHPDQVREASEDARMRGVPTEFHEDGRMVVRSRAHQKAYLKAYGSRWFNKDGGYGD